MVIIMNGKQTEIDGEVTVSQLLETQYVEMKEYVTVQLNEEIIPRADYDIAIVKEGAVIEFLYYMGGGACDAENR